MVKSLEKKALIFSFIIGASWLGQCEASVVLAPSATADEAVERVKGILAARIQANEDFARDLTELAVQRNPESNGARFVVDMWQPKLRGKEGRPIDQLLRDTEFDGIRRNFSQNAKNDGMDYDVVGRALSQHPDNRMVLTIALILAESFLKREDKQDLGGASARIARKHDLWEKRYWQEIVEILGPFCNKDARDFADGMVILDDIVRDSTGKPIRKRDSRSGRPTFMRCADTQMTARFRPIDLDTRFPDSSLLSPGHTLRTLKDGIDRIFGAAFSAGIIGRGVDIRDAYASFLFIALRAYPEVLEYGKRLKAFKEDLERRERELILKARHERERKKAEKKAAEQQALRLLLQAPQTGSSQQEEKKRKDLRGAQKPKGKKAARQIPNAGRYNLFHCN